LKNSIKEADVVTSEEEKLSTREVLLNTASAIMAKRGDTQVTLSDIGKASGFNTALVRYYFGNKHGMMFALLERAMQGALENGALTLSKTESYKTQMRNHIQQLSDMLYEYPYLIGLWTDIYETDDEYSKTLSDDYTQQILGFQRALLEGGYESGEFQEIDPMFFHYFVIGAFDVFYRNSLALKKEFSIDGISSEVKAEYAQQITDIIFSGISTT